MNQFPKRNNLPKLTQEEIDYLNRLISSEEFKSIISNFPKQKKNKKKYRPDGFTREFYQIFKEELFEFSTIFSRRQKQREYILTCCVRAALP